MVNTKVTPMGERLARKYVQDGDCWRWIGGTNGRYGNIWNYETKTKQLAHRASYEWHVGPIPEGMTLDHLCRTPLCVNPQHLEPVTQAENNRRMFADMTHCARGHEFTEENTRIYRGHRRCRACDRESKRGPNFMPVAERTHCGNGHPRTTENTYVDRHGTRYCRECRRAAHKRRRAEQLDREFFSQRGM